MVGIQTRRVLVYLMGITAVSSVAVMGMRVHRDGCLPRTHAELSSLKTVRLEKVDIARVNLLCAEGLPGAENLNVEECLITLDEWAELVRANEEKYSLQFFQEPKRYDHSLAKFKVVNLGLTLKNDLHCGYDTTLIESGAMNDVRSIRFFKSSESLFLHGFVESRMGSCTSLPVLMVAIGRRCGYPLHLVSCKGHLFCRWDDGVERFNIETACPGVDMKPDEYYTQWPHPASEQEIETEKYLKNLSREEVFAVFSRIRATCLEENGRYEEAAEAYTAALPAFPESMYLKAYLRDVTRKQGVKL
ncbi:hypothetical protein P4C99_21795 [Pontiellaceae bacterium B1224]|nr:hypothetical protein [Pontiellaceae bacterium B1224]